MSEIPGVREPGVSPLGIVEPAGEACDVCGRRPGLRHRCPSDGRHHRHGMIHAHRGGDFPLLWLCDSCYQEELRQGDYNFGGWPH